MKLRIHTFDLELKHTFAISRESRTVQQTLIVELQENGFSGFGEATASLYYHTSIEEMTSVLEDIRPWIQAQKMVHPETFWTDFQTILAGHPFVQCALDEAANDLFAKKLGKPLFATWGLSLNNLPNTNLTIGIDAIDKMVEKIETQPWSVYKIKLGTDNDLEIIETLRKHTDSVFRVDANCAWSVGEAIEKSKELKKLNVEFIEQPLKAEDWEGMNEVFRRSALPVFADESCRKEADLEKCQSCFHGINIKLMKCGGLTPSRRMIAHARHLGMKVMVGCMTESSIGISAIAHLLPLLDHVDMDGPLLIKNDPAVGVIIEDGAVHFPAENGIGCRLKMLN